MSGAHVLVFLFCSVLNGDAIIQNDKNIFSIKSGNSSDFQEIPNIFKFAPQVKPRKFSEGLDVMQKNEQTNVLETAYKIIRDTKNSEIFKIYKEFPDAARNKLNARKKNSAAAELWSYIRPSQQDPDIQGEEYTKLLKSDLVPSGSILEIGDCSYSVIVAEGDSKKTVVCMLFSEITLQNVEANIEARGLDNIFVTFVPSGESLQKIISELFVDYKVLFGSIWLSNFPSLRDFLLPHEIDELLMRLFSLSYNVLIPKTNFKKVFPNPKGSGIEAIENICRIGQLTCNIIKPNASSTIMTYHVEILLAKRYFLEKVSSIWKHNSKCFLEYGLVTSEINFHVGLAQSYRIPSDLKTVVTLKTLLTMGLSLSSKELIFVKLLRIDTSLTNGSQAIYFHGSKVHTESKEFLLSFELNNLTPWKHTHSAVNVKLDESTVTTIGPESIETKLTTNIDTSSRAQYIRDFFSKKNISDLSDEEQKLKMALEDLQNSSQLSTTKMISPSPTSVQNSPSNYKRDIYEHPPGLLKTVYQDNTTSADNELYSLLWQKIKECFPADRNEYFNFFTVGGKKNSMIGSKIATLYHRASVLSVCPLCSKSEKINLREIRSSLPVNNQLLSFDAFSASTVQMLYKLPQIFRYQVLGQEIFRKMVTMKKHFLLYFGQLLSLAQITFLELPNQSILKTVLSFLSSKESAVFSRLKNVVRKALEFVNCVAKIEIMGEAFSSYNMSLIKVELISMNRKIISSCKTDLSALEYHNGITTLHFSNNRTSQPVTRTRYDFSLELLLNINLPHPERSELFQNYLKLRVLKDMCPSNILWYNQTLVHDYSFDGHFTKQVNFTRRFSETSLCQLLQKELHSTSFSFVFHSSQYDKDFVWLAETYKNSTFVALKSEYEEAKTLYMKTSHLNNVAVNNIAMSPFIIKSLCKSPEMFRYQFIGANEMLMMIESYNQNMFKKLLTSILASSVTTFIQFPSSEIISLALKAFGKHNNTQEQNLSFVNIINETLQLDTKGDIDLKVVREFISPGPQIPWTLIRFDIKHLTHMVNHHFLSERDGHLTKYTKHCVAFNKTAYEVYLVRNTDNFKIPYGALQGISLVALLRMGLLQELKDKFYSQFLRLPLYADMAPWNIVFQAGTMVYIDYDTKNRTYDELVPYANQVYLLLINFARTVQDFDKCGKSAVSQFGFDIGSSCVKSDVEVECNDPLYPVPCADGRCKSTYIECLRAIDTLKVSDQNYKGG